MSLCLSHSFKLLLFCFSMESSHFLPSFLHVSLYKTFYLDFWFRPPKPPKFTPQNCLRRYITTSSPVVALLAQQLCLGKVGNPMNFGADPCCHGNEIWTRHGDPVAYRLTRSIAWHHAVHSSIKFPRWDDRTQANTVRWLNGHLLCSYWTGSIHLWRVAGNTAWYHIAGKKQVMSCSCEMEVPKLTAICSFTFFWSTQSVWKVPACILYLLSRCLGRVYSIIYTFSYQYAELFTLILQH